VNRSPFALLAPTLVAIILALSAPVSSQKPPPSPARSELSPEALRAQAEQLYLQGDAEGAELVFLDLAELSSAAVGDRSEALITAAWLQYSRQLDEQALRTLERALDIDAEVVVDESMFDTDFATLVSRARDNLSMKRRDTARQHLAVARRQLDEGNLTEARRGLELALAPGAGEEITTRALYSLGLLEMKAGNEDAARLRFEDVLSVRPSPALRLLHAASHINLGTILFRKGLLARAELAWERATELDPDAAVAWKNLGLARAQRNDHAGALLPLRSAHTLQPEDSETTRLLARSLTTTGALDEAVSILHEALDRQPKDAKLWLALGSALRAADRGASASTALESAVRLDPLNQGRAASQAAALLSLIAIENERFDDAERWSRSALAWEEHLADHWNSLAIALRGQGRLEEAETSSRRSVALDPTRPELLANLASILIHMDRVDEAEESLQAALALDPTNVVVAEGLSQIRSRRRETQVETAPPKVASSPSRRAKPIAPKKLGVRFIELDYDRLGLRGALVREVAKRSPAARTGLRRGDLVLRIGGHKVLDNRDFFDHLKRNPPVEGMEIEILRDATIETLSLQVY